MLSYTTSGNAKKHLVCLHGFLENKSMWAFLTPLCKDFCLVAIDLPGHGNSPDPEYSQQPSMIYYAQKVIEVIEKENIENFILIGHSMGAYVGLEVMAHNKTACKKLIFLNSNCWSDSEEKKRERQRLAKIISRVKTLFLSEAIPRLFGEPHLYAQEIKSLIKSANKMTWQSIAFSSLSMAHRSDYSRWVQKDPEKFIFIHGKKDDLINLETLISRIGTATLHSLEHSGHMSHIEEENNVKRIISAHI